MWRLRQWQEAEINKMQQQRKRKSANQVNVKYNGYFVAVTDFQSGQIFDGSAKLELTDLIDERKSS